ncbi:MAG: (2Fe-2S)-binding protein [Oscillospiraceae bacterium]
MEKNTDKMVCHCDKVPESAILAAIDAGASTLADIRRMTGACTSGNCEEMNPTKRCCAGEIKQLLKQRLAEKM